MPTSTQSTNAGLRSNSGVTRRKEAVAEIERAEELDPLFVLLRVNVGVVYSYGGQHDQAIEQLQTTSEQEPKYDYARYELGLAYLRKGMYPEAIANLQKAVDMVRNDPYESMYFADLGYAYAAAGQRSKALEILRRLKKQEAEGKHVAAGQDGGLYPIYFALGQKDQALAWLQKAYKERSDSLVYLRCWPGFDRLRSDPGFAELFHRVGIPP